MFVLNRRLKGLLVGTTLALACGAPAMADDTEIFSTNSLSSDVRPNILFIMDTSGSMSEEDVELAKPPYDSSTSYDGSCDKTHVYYSRGTAGIPKCDTVAWVNLSAVKCAAAVTGMGGVAGFWTGRAAHWNPAFNQWKDLRASAPAEFVECFADSGVHGETAASGKKYARNGDPANKWTSTVAQRLDWNAIGTHTLYSGNYLNWKYSPETDATKVNRSRISVVQRALTELASSVDDVNIGFMRFSDNCSEGRRCGFEESAQGGMILQPIDSISKYRADLIKVANLQLPGGNTPLSETMYEAGQYWAGKSVRFGLSSRGRDADPADGMDDGERKDMPSVASSRNGDAYKTPIQYQCQKNFNILLTDGLPTRDSDADDEIVALTDARARGFASLTGSASCNGDGTGKCLDDMAAYLANADLVDVSTAGNPDTQEQHVLTYAIGFGGDVPSGSAFLEDVADRGGTGSPTKDGDSFNAQNLDQLVDTLRKIVTDINDGGTSFVTPSVSVNSFNRNQTLNDLYVSVFAPSQTEHWPGNLKKYRLVKGQIVDVTDAAAVGPDGFFKKSAQSIWSPEQDGQDVDAGGAANLIPAPASRVVYTQFAAGPLNTAANLLNKDNGNLTDAVLGTGTAPTRDELIDWVHDLDLKNGGNRFMMGDPLHSRPAIVTYGGAAGSPNAYDTVVYVATNDGYLHAITGASGYDTASKKSTGGGAELWSFIPQELLGRMVNVFRDGTIANRSYGLDGDVRVLKYDVNQNGIVESGDKVILFFGMRRGGRHYYALDVTDRNAPKFLWKAGPDQLPGIGETWSPPVITRVKVGTGSGQNDQKLVLLFGGGYDDGEENYSYVKDDSGHRIFMVDALSGNLLWYAGGPDGAATPAPNLLLDSTAGRNGTMNNAIPAELTVVDTNGDRFADRIYAADLGGRIWRFDITNGNDANTLVAGGVIARLGGGDTASPTIPNTRRFYNAPDVALIERRAADPYYNIAIGSGYRGHPTQRSTTAVYGATSDRFYSIRDKAPFAVLRQTDYDSLVPIIDSNINLVDITGNLANAVVPPDKLGWKLDLRLNGTGVGEKVLAGSITANNVVLFPTYQPADPTTADPCLPTGINRVYALRVDNGRAALDFTGDDKIDAADASTKLNQSGIVDSVNVGVIREDDPSAPGGGGSAPTTVCLAGVEVLKKCVVVGGTVRTYWKRK